MTHRERANDRIPPQALAVVITMFVVELNFLRTPKAIAAAAGRDSWLAIALAGIAMTGAVWLMHNLARRFPHMTLVEMARAVLGPLPGVVIVLVYLGFWLLRAGTLLLIQSYLFADQLLPQTPEPVLSLYMLLLSAYLVRHGLEPIARLFVVLLGTFVILLLPVVALGAAGMDAHNLLPVLERGWRPVLHGAWVTYGAAVGPTLILMTGPFLTRWKGALRAAIAGVLMVFVPGMILNVIIHGHLDERGVMVHTWPTLAVLEIIEIPGFSGLRLDPLFLSIWSLLVFATVSLAHYLSATVLQRLFRWESNVWPVRITTAVIGVTAVAPLQPLAVMEWMERITPWVVPTITVVFPGLLLAVARLRGMGTSRSPKGA